jgi:quinol monooxygenase YgiN
MTISTVMLYCAGLSAVSLRRTDMVNVIFRVKMKPGKEDAALAQFRKMVKSVEANEPGVLVYAFHRLQDDPSELVFWEAYADDAAFKAHAGTPHMGEMRAAFAELFDPTTVKLERLERIAGFVRAG